MNNGIPNSYIVSQGIISPPSPNSKWSLLAEHTYTSCCIMWNSTDRTTVRA